MTIQRGQPWGEATLLPPNTYVANSDAAAREWIVRERAASPTIRPFAISGGDLATTIGGAPERLAHTGGQPTVTALPIDLLRVEADGAVTWAISHVVGFRAWWKGAAFLAMNAQYYKGLDVAPRAHPNDGRCDIIEVDPDMSLRQRLTARRRARLGTHLPHPQLRTSSQSSTTISLAETVVVWVDGQRWRTTDRIHVVVEPDAALVYA